MLIEENLKEFLEIKTELVEVNIHIYYYYYYYYLLQICLKYMVINY